METVLRAADRDPTQRPARRTETQFVLGQLALANGQEGLARRSFQAAVAEEQIDLVEYQGTVLKLDRLGPP